MCKHLIWDGQQSQVLKFSHFVSVPCFLLYFFIFLIFCTKAVKISAVFFKSYLKDFFFFNFARI